MRTYTVVLFEDSDDGGKWTATIPAVPGAYSWGYTKEEALEHVQEALEVMLEFLEEQGEPIPEEHENVFVASVTARAA
jgi:predicted RNase H-like HicB family nuclease